MAGLKHCSKVKKNWLNKCYPGARKGLLWLMLQTLKLLKKHTAVSFTILTLLVSCLIGFTEPKTLAQRPVLDTDPVIRQPVEPENPVQRTPNDPAPEEINEINPNRPVFTIKVSESQSLPPDLYGTWQVTGYLISTNAPYTFKRKTTDIWLLDQFKDKIRLANPDTGTQTFVTVNNVIRNRATFTVRTQPTRKYEQLEQVHLKVDGDEFSGSSILRIEYKQKNQLLRVEQALFKIIGTKLSGPTPDVFQLQSK